MRAAPRCLCVAAAALLLYRTSLAGDPLFRLNLQTQPDYAVALSESRSDFLILGSDPFGMRKLHGQSLSYWQMSLSDVPSGTDRFPPPGVTIVNAPERPQSGWALLVSAAAVAGSALNSFDDGPNEKFHFTSERWFQQDTYAGGGDKASHFVSYNVVSKELAIVYQGLGYSTRESRLMGFVVATFTGFVTEIGDGRGQYGFSYEDFLADTAGAASAAVIAAYGWGDLVGFRAGVMRAPDTPKQYSVNGLGKDYSREIYTADLKLVGLARRAHVDPGLARYLLFSLTYGVKGYPYAEPEFRQRQVGFEIGLNLGQVIWDLGVDNEKWWGIALHFIFDNIRFPYTAIGYRYDLNHRQWHGPDSGNSFSFTLP